MDLHRFILHTLDVQICDLITQYDCNRLCTMKIAVEGCCHDELELIYDTVEHIQKVKNITVDLLLICGDFEATRNPDDLVCMACPPKYRDMKYFYK